MTDRRCDWHELGLFAAARAIRNGELSSEAYAAPVPTTKILGDQNEQWCLAAKSVTTCGCGGTSEITCAGSNDGQRTAAEDGSPLAAKFAEHAKFASPTSALKARVGNP